MTYRQIAYNGLWQNNTSLVQLLGLCPTLAISTTLTNGVGLGIATTLVLIASNVTIAFIRNIVPAEVRLPIFVLVIAAFVTAIEMLMKAFYYELYLILGIYIPLIVTNCIIIGRAEAFACKHKASQALVDGLMMGLGFTLALMLLSGIREVLGYGTLFAQIELMFGPASQWLTVTVFDHYHGFLIAILPPGAFFGLGLLIALKKAIELRVSSPKLPKTLEVAENGSGSCVNPKY